MIGLALAVALAASPAPAASASAVAASQPPAAQSLAVAEQAPAAASEAPARTHRRQVRQPVPKSALYVGTGLALLLALAVHLLRRPSTRFQPLKAVTRAISLTGEAWRRATGPMLLVVAMQAWQMWATARTAANPAAPSALLLNAGPVLGMLLVFYLVPGAVYRLAFGRLAPDRPEFGLGPLGVQFGRTEGRAFGAGLLLLLGLIPLWLAAYLAGAALSPAIDGLWPSLPWSSALPAPTQQAVDYTLFTMLTQVGGARFATFIPRRAAGLANGIGTCWRETARDWAPISLLLSAQAATWWLAILGGEVIGRMIARQADPIASLAWGLVCGVAFASSTAFQVAVATEVFLQSSDAAGELTSGAETLLSTFD